MTELLPALAKFVVEAPLEPDNQVRNTVRDSVIDALGCILAGARTGPAKAARAAVRAMAAEGPCQVIGTTMRTSRPQAAFLNAVAGHALDFDDWEIPGNTHPTVVILPAVLSSANPATTGSDIVQAYLAGFEVIARLGEALNFEHYDQGWHSTATLGTIGAAAAVARLKKLAVETTTNALSLAVSMASGYTCQFGTSAKPLQAGFAARAGVETAHLAAAGLTAKAHVLDHPRGMAALMANADPDRLQFACQKLGKRLALSEYGIVLKPWPSCGYTHRMMTCILDLRDRLDTGAIEKIELFLPDFHARVLPFQQPKSRNEALFSLPFVAAMGLLRGNLTLTDLNDEPWRSRQIQGLIELAETHPFEPLYPSQNYSEDDADRIVVHLKGGVNLEGQCAYPLGAPQRPMTSEQLWQKFSANAGPVAETWWERLRAWPECGNILALFTDTGLNR